MKVLAAADHHWDEHRRFNECMRVHDFMIEVAEREGVDLFVSAGDIYERASTPREREAVARWLIRMASICPVLIAKGNHEKPLDLRIMGALESAYPIVVEEAASVHYLGGFAVGAVAWPDRGVLAAGFKGQNAQELDATAQDALRNVLRGLGQELSAYDGPRLLIGHFMIDGSVTSVGQPLIGHTMNIGLADLSLARCPLVIAGHVHAPQSWKHGDCDILYTGSPFRTTFGEVEEKSVVLAEYDGERLIGWKRIPTPCAPMFLAASSWPIGETWEWAGLPEDPAHLVGAEIRLRFDVPADQRAAAKAAVEAVKADLLERGAADVKIEEQVVSTIRARAPEIVTARSLRDKMLALWKARDSAPDDVRAARILGKVDELEAAS